jgi:prepilin-type N-terminal cleavage/methylation domain-containing protein
VGGAVSIRCFAATQPAPPTRAEQLPPISYFQSQRGFTLTELLVALGLISVVTGVLVTVIYQFYSISRWGNAQMAVDADLRNAGLWLVRDGNESHVLTPTLPCNTFTFDTGRSRLYTYTMSGSTLNRTDSQTGQTIGVARRLTAPPVCNIQGRMAMITLTSAMGSVSSSATFTVTLRVD